MRTTRRLEDVEVLAEGAERRIVARAATARCSSPAPTASASTTRTSTASSTTSPTTLTSAATSPAACIRINRDGSIPKDNPWLGRATVAPETFAHGLRGSRRRRDQSRRPASCGSIDHGPQGGDEINIIRAGKDYGWPDVSYGVQYDARQTRWPQERAGRQRQDVDERRRGADLLLGAVDRAVRA